MNIISSSSAVPPASDLPALLAAKGIVLKDPTNQDELANAVLQMKRLNAAQKNKISHLNDSIQMQFEKTHSAAKEVSVRTPDDEAALEKMKQTVKQIEKLFACSICKELAILPLVLVPCGHIACEECINKKEEQILKELKEDASPIQYLLNRKCTICNVPTSTEYPAKAIKTIIEIVAAMGFLPIKEKKEYETIPFDKARAMALRIAASEDLIASARAAAELISKIGYEEWGKGVVFQFPKECSYTFYEGFEWAVMKTVKNVTIKRIETQRALQASVPAELLVLEYPKEGFTDLSKAKLYASELLKRASKSQAHIKELSSEKPSDLPSKEKTPIVETIAAADAAMKAATEMMKAIKPSEQRGPSISLAEINAAIKKALQAQADYFKSYLQIRNSITFNVDPHDLIKEVYNRKTALSAVSK